MPQPLDPSGFQLSVEIVTAGAETGAGSAVSAGVGARGSETRFPLWLRSSPDGEGITLDPGGGVPGDLPIVESVEIKMSLSLVSTVTINIAAPYELGLRLLDSELFVIGNTYEVRVGYPRIGRFLPWISARAAKPSLTINPDEGLTATLNGVAGAFAALRGTSSRTYTGSYREVLTQIANRPHNNWLTEFPERQEGDPFDESRGQFSQSNRSEWFFVQMLARGANCDAYIRPSRGEAGRNVLVVTRRREMFAQDVRYTFVMRGQIDMRSVPRCGYSVWGGGRRRGQPRGV
jgi:hypothetical protein